MVDVPGAAVVVVAATQRRRQFVTSQGSGEGVVVLVVAVVPVVVVVEDVVEDVVVLAQPPTGGFQIRPPLPLLPATNKHSPWHKLGDGRGSPVVVDVVAVDSATMSGRSLDHVPFLCRQI